MATPLLPGERCAVAEAVTAYVPWAGEVFGLPASMLVVFSLRFPCLCVSFQLCPPLPRPLLPAEKAGSYLCVFPSAAPQ